MRALEIDAAVASVFEARRRRVYLIGLCLSLPAILATWLASDDSDPMVRWGYPVLGFMLLGAGLSVHLRPRCAPGVQTATLLGVAAVWLGRLAFELGLHADPVAAWSAVQPWGFMGVLLISVFAYILLPSRVALGFGIALSTIAGLLMAWRLVPAASADGNWDLAVALLRSESYLAVTLAFVYLLALTKDSAVEAGIEADRMRTMAYRCPLTGLPNRRALSELLDREVDHARRTALSVIAIDLDEFKQVNDTYGHHAGDLVLQAAALSLQNEVRSSDTVGRWGGEEFLVVCPGTTREEATELAQRLRALLARDLVLDTITITGSFGVVQYTPGMSVTALLGRADALMYAAKEGGRNRVVSTPFVPRSRGDDGPAVTLPVRRPRSVDLAAREATVLDVTAVEARDVLDVVAAEAAVDVTAGGPAAGPRPGSADGEPGDSAVEGFDQRP